LFEEFLRILLSFKVLMNLSDSRREEQAGEEPERFFDMHQPVWMKQRKFGKLPLFESPKR
jgi:hypothetical protein